MLNRIILILFALGAISSANSQNRRGIKVLTGIGHINNYNYVENGEFRTRPSFAAQLGVFQEWNVKERIVLGAEILGSYVRGKDEFILPFPDPTGAEPARYKDKEFKDVFYLSVPLWIGWKVNRWTFNVGGQTSVFLGGVRSQNSWVEAIDHVSNWQEGKVVNAKRVEFGPRAAMIFNVNERLALEASYYHGLTNAFFWIYDVRTNIRHGLVGVRWAIN